MNRGPTSHTFISQRLKLHYVDWGNEQAPPLLLLHGGQDHCRSWDWIAEQLSADWHVICPDLRGHGDSDWSPDGDYSRPTFIYDLAQLIHQKQLAPLTIVAHSMGGFVALCYAGLYPDNVAKLAVIEGFGFPSERQVHEDQKPVYQRLDEWITNKRSASARLPKRYASREEALLRMKKENRHLSDEQALHLTRHGVSQNEDGTYSWKFDNYTRFLSSQEFTEAQLCQLWSRIPCPVFLAWGTESFLPVPSADDARLNSLQNVSLSLYPQAGHWLHHDQPDRLIDELKAFMRP